VVWLDDFDEKEEYSWLEISDRGIGMTEKVLTDYFLTAGASFRHSEQWQRTFETSDPKAKTKSQVLRSGRFGVGALAAFLLGDWMEVETRHVTSETGFRFSMNLTDDAVQVERADGLAVGTRIRVRVTKSAYDKLDKGPSTTRPAAWDWYVLHLPSVRRVTGKLKLPKNQRYAHDLSTWRLLQADLLYTVHWSFETAHSLAVNGIFVSNSGRLPSLANYKWEKSEIGVFMPNLHISDPDGNLPLGLTRKELLADDYGFENELYESVMKDFIAWVLVYFPEQPTGPDLFSVQFHPAVGKHWEYSSGLHRERIDWLLDADGFALPFDGIFDNHKPVRRLLVLSGESAIERISKINHWDCVVIQGGLVFHSLRFSGADDDIVAELFHEESKLAWKQTVKEFRATVAHNELLLPRPAEKFTQRIKDRTVQRKDKKNAEKSAVIETKSVAASPYPFIELAELQPQLNEKPYAAEMTFKEPAVIKMDSGILGRWWRRYFGTAWLPWSYAERRKRFPKAFEELSASIKFYESET
jgi:molecular chaperone HtpG